MSNLLDFHMHFVTFINILDNFRPCFESALNSVFTLS